MERIGRKAWVVGILLALAACRGWADPSPEVLKGAAWLQNQVSASGDIADVESSVATPLQIGAEIVHTLTDLATTPSSTLVDAIGAEPDGNAEYLARQILAYHQAGRSGASFASSLIARQNADGGFGTWAGYPSNFHDTAWAVLALGAHDPSLPALAGAAAYLVQGILADGGMDGRSAVERIETSALALQALKPFSAPALLNARSQLTGRLLRQRAVDGSWGQDDYLTALSLATVVTETADGGSLDSARQFLLGRQGGDGSWAGDSFLTAWALRALLPRASQAPGGAPGQAVLSGRLVDAASGMALGGAVVRLAGTSSYEVASDGDGRFTLRDIPGGDYLFSVARTGYVGVSQPLQVIGGQFLDLGDIALAADPASAILRGTVTAGATGLPLADAVVSVAGMAQLQTITNAMGQYELAGVSPGPVTVTASATGYQEASGSGMAVAGQVLLFSPALYGPSEPPPSTGRWRGSVVAAGSGLALAGVRIELNGAVLASTAVDGSFSLSLAPASYSFSLLADGYDPLSGSIVVTAGGVVDSGSLVMNSRQTTSSLSGTVVDDRSGNPLAGALVEIVGGSYTNTDAQGKYRMAGLAGNRFDVRVSSAGYATQLVQLTADRPLDMVRDFRLAAVQSWSVQLDALQVAPDSAASQTQISFGSAARSTDADSLNLVAHMQVLGADGKVVGSAPAYDAGGNLLGAFTLAPGEAKPMVFRWSTGQFPPGAYRVVARLSEAGTVNAGNVLGQVVAERAGSFQITPGARLGGTVTADPPVLQAGTNTAVHLSAAIRNEGNVNIPAGNHRLEAVLKSTGARTLLQDVALEAIPVGALVSVSFNDWLPPAQGEYRVDLVPGDASVHGGASASVYVGDAAYGRFSLDRTVVPKGTQTVRGAIAVTGQDTITGAISDPLASAIRQAVQKAVNYNDPIAANWVLSNRCLGCHVASQALVGGDLNRERTTYNAGYRNTLFNALTGYQQNTGYIDASHPMFARTQTTLGLWALSNWHNKDEIALTLTRAANYLAGQQDGDGGWSADHASGWWAGRPANTAVNLRSLVNVHGVLDRAASVTDYAPQAWVSGGLNGAFYLASDATGNVYVSNFNAGTVVRITPAGIVESWLSAITNPRGIVVAADGATYVASAGGLVRRKPDGAQSVLAALNGYGLALGPDGNLYVSDAAANRIYRVTPAGQTTVYLEGGSLNSPRGLAFSPTGDMIVSNYDNLKILRVKPDKSVEEVVSWTDGNPRAVVPYGDGWLVGTTTGLYRYNADWQGQRLTFQVSHGVTVTPDGRIVSGDGASSVYKNIPAEVNLAARKTAYAAAISKAANWLLNDANINNANNPDVAFRLMGMGAARNFYKGTPLETSLLAKMQQADTLLRSRQRADGGWGLWNGWGSDSMVTAMAGMALDELSPSPSDPVIRKAVQWLLSTQAADGSWYSQNGILSSRMAATTWVAIWLPIALDRIGGIDTDLTVALPAGITLANPSPAPVAMGANDAGGTTYTFAMRGVTRVGESLGFDLTFHDLLLNETRLAAKAAYLTFKNSFTGQPMDAPIDIPAVTAVSSLGLTVSTDRAVYGEGDTVRISAPVSNVGATAVGGSVRLAVAADDGVPVADLGLQPVAPLQPGASLTVSKDWNTGKTLAGGYRVIATLLDADGVPAGRASAPFTLVGGAIGGGGAALTSTVRTDKALYQSSETVWITGRVFNGAGNFIWDNLTLRERVLDPLGNEAFNAAQAIAQLPGNAYAERLFPLALKGAMAGSYRVEQTVTDAAGTVKDSRTAEFSVASTAVSGYGLGGTLQAAPHTVPQGDTVMLNHVLSNQGNATVAGLTVLLRILEPSSGLLVAEWRNPTDLPVGGHYAATQPYGSGGLVVGTTYVAALYAVIDGRETPLAQDSFRVVEPPIKLNLSAAPRDEARLLVLVSCEPGYDAKGGRLPADLACARQRAQWLDAQLTARGVDHHIATAEPDFTDEMRCGRYNVYWVSGGAEKLDPLLIGELRAAVRRGDGLLLDDIHDERNRLGEAIAGVLYRGKLPQRGYLVDLSGPLFDSVTQLASEGRALKYDLAGGLTQGAFPAAPGLPAVVSHGLGEGRSVLFAFDLAGSLQAREEWWMAFDAALRHLAPPPPADYPGGALVPLKLTVANAGQAVSVLVTAHLPPAATLHGVPPGAVIDAQGEAQWRFDLAKAASRTLTLDVRAPLATGTYRVTFPVRTVSNGVTRDYAQVPLAFPVQGSDVAGPRLSTAIAALAPTAAAERNARDKALAALQSALAALAQNRALDAIPPFLQASDELTRIKTVPVDAAQLGLARLLAEAESKVCTAPF